MSTTIPIVTRPRDPRFLDEDLVSLVRGSQQARPVVLASHGTIRVGRSISHRPPRTASRSSRIPCPARTLKQLDEGFGSRYGKLRERYTSLVYSSILPEPLQALISRPGATAP